ncbi:MAG: hypothetical protein WB424_15055 [Terracidiphilus sp.]
MRKFIGVIFLLACGVFAVALVHAQSEPQQDSTLKVFIAPLTGPDADLVKTIRAKLISDFEKHDIVVTNIKEDADAILTGSGLMQSNFATSVSHRPRYRIRGSMRLVNKNGVALWAADVSSSQFAVSETSSFVEKVTEKVAEALSEESKRLKSEPTVHRINQTN